jgi:acetyltransferase-like isoleucine patch superfamily enzyme
MITVGCGTAINNMVRCFKKYFSIRIGVRCLIGANAATLDSNFHGLGIEERNGAELEWSAPVVFEDCGVIGSHERHLNGVRFGLVSVIAISSVVIMDAPPMVVAGDVPAKMLRQIL